MALNLNLHAVVLAVGLAVVWRVNIYIQNRRVNPKRLPLPPGPKGYPIIGSLLEMPNVKAWLVYDEWSKTYGDMIYFEALGTPFLILGKYERAYDLFEKRSSNYSDRPRLPMILELMDWGYNMGFLPYGEWWRRHRRAIHDQFHPNIVHKHQPVQVEGARAFLRRLLETPDDFMAHIRLLFASTIMKLAYGITVKGMEDPYIKMIEEALAGVNEAALPGAFLVDLIPAMKHIPSWFPGATWKRKAERWKYINNRVVSIPFQQVKDEMAAGTAIPSIATSVIEKLPPESAPNRAEEEEIAADTCAISYAAGADTTLSTIQSFFMAMTIYPEVQKKARVELDAVLGGRFPEFSDRPSLPYINAIVKEAMRWQVVVPLAVVHKCSEDDEYNGYFIPKGTLVMGNSWSILHDPETYPDPLTFNPDRFIKDGKINPKVRDPTVAAFGYGRRICPARFFVDNSLYTIIAHVLSVFEIGPGVDENGKEIDFKHDMTNGLISYPVPFPCKITPRSKMAEDLIRLNTEILD